jgi:hypothetical protein
MVNLTHRRCVQFRVTVRRVSNHPYVRSGKFLQKHVVRGATLSLVPGAVNDMAFHHAQLNIDEFFHVVQDTTSIGVMTLALALTLAATKPSGPK